MEKEKTVKAPAPLSPVAQEILELVKASETPLTLAQIKVEISGANPAHLTALRNRGLVDASEIELEVLKPVKSKVLQYRAKGE